MTEIVDHPICADCDGRCCDDAKWSHRFKGRWVEWLSQFDRDELMKPEFWQEHLIDHKATKFGNKPPRLRAVRVVSLSKGLRQLWLACECLDHDKKTGRCRVYQDRPETCRNFPTAWNIAHRSSVGWCALVDVLAAQPAPENYMELI